MKHVPDEYYNGLVCKRVKLQILKKIWQGYEMLPY